MVSVSPDDISRRHNAPFKHPFRSTSESPVVLQSFNSPCAQDLFVTMLRLSNQRRVRDSRSNADSGSRSGPMSGSVPSSNKSGLERQTRTHHTSSVGKISKSSGSSVSGRSNSSAVHGSTAIGTYPIPSAVKTRTTTSTVTIIATDSGLCCLIAVCVLLMAPGRSKYGNSGDIPGVVHYSLHHSCVR